MNIGNDWIIIHPVLHRLFYRNTYIKNKNIEFSKCIHLLVNIYIYVFI